MKRWVGLAVMGLLLAGLLCACAPNAYTPQTDRVAKVLVTDSSGRVVTLNDADVTDRLFDLITQAQFAPTDEPESLPQEQIRFTFSGEKGEALATYSVFSNDLIQIDEALYTGNTEPIRTLLGQYLIAPTKLEVSELFGLSAKTVAEIAFHNLSDGSFKIVTGSGDIGIIMTAIQAAKPLEQQTVITEEPAAFRIYARPADADQYLPALTFYALADGLLVQCGDRQLAISSFDWQGLYRALHANKMPLTD